MSHECPQAVRSKLRDQRVRKHARRIWSVGEAVRSRRKVLTGTGSAGTDRTNGILTSLRSLQRRRLVTPPGECR